MDEGGEACIGFVGAHGDAFEFLELAEKVLDQVTPFVHFFVDRQFAGSTLMLGDDDLGASFVEIGDDGVAVEGCVGDQCAKAYPIDQRRHADGVEPMPGQKNEAYEIAESVSQREDFGRQASFWNVLWPGPESPFCALSVAIDLDDCCIDDGVFHVRFIRTGLEKPHENVGFNPVAVSLEDRVPLAE